MPEIAARPYSYAFELPSTALVVIDMQRDFIERGGFGEALGNDVGRLAAIVPSVAALIEWCRARGIRVLHTREGHRPDLTDCPPAKLRRGAPALRIGAAGPMGRILVDGEPGNDIVPACAPRPGETEIRQSTGLRNGRQPRAGLVCSTSPSARSRLAARSPLMSVS